ncbi:MAG: hypothetical protein M1826_000830 [Phylliscum demangeonii]|nr:MAG: hypothetical protein M1826_000830 [Phylliscum demangeonii]
MLSTVYPANGNSCPWKKVLTGLGLILTWLCWDGDTPLDAASANARLPQILDRVLWALAMEPVLQGVGRRVEPLNRPEPLPPTEPAVVPISRSMSRDRRERLLQIAGLSAVLCAYWDRSALGNERPIPMPTVWQQVGLTSNPLSRRVDGLAPFHWETDEVATTPAVESCERLHRFTQGWHARMHDLGHGRNRIVAMGLIGVAEFWSAWLHVTIPVSPRSVVEWLAQDPTGAPQASVYRLDVAAWLRRLHATASTLPFPTIPDTYKTINLR